MRGLFAKRLLKLAEHLRTVPPDAFNLDYWKCGTVACACGHACDIPSFRRAGLGLRQAYLSNPEGQYMLTYRGLGNMQAACTFFGLVFGDAMHLFCPERYPADNRTTPKRVAARIRSFVRKSRPDLMPRKVI